MKSLAIALVVTAALAGCFPKTTAAPPTLSAAQVDGAATRWPTATPDALANGRAVYTAKCNECHGYPDPHAVEEAKWGGVMSEMGKKAKLSPKDTDDVLHFVLAAGAGP